MVLDRIRRLAVRNLPRNLAFVEVDRRDASPGRLHDRNSVDGESTTAIFGGAPAADVGHVGSLGIVDHREHAHQCVGIDVEHARVGIERAAWPVGAVGDEQQAFLAVLAAHNRRREQRADLVLRDQRHRFGLDLWREVDDEVFEKTLALERRRLGGEGLRRRVPLARHRAFLDRPLFDRPHRLTGLAVEHVDEPLLGGLGDRRDLASVHRDVDENGRARDVVIPNGMVHELVVPDALAGLQINREQAFAEQVVAGAMAAKVVAGRNLHRQVGDAELFVDGHLRPHAGVAGVFPRAFAPGVVAELAGQGNSVENPQPLAGARIVGADIALGVLAAARRGACPMGGADQHHVLGDYRSAVPGDFALDRIEVLIRLFLQIDDAVDAEILKRTAGLRIKTHQLIPDGHVEDALVALAVGPVPDTAAREPARRQLRATAFFEPVHPQQLAGGGVERHGIAMLAGSGVEHAVDHQRRGLQVEVGARAEALGLEPPRHFELLEVGGIDLIERSIAGDAEVPTPRAPLAAGGPVLRADVDRQQRHADDGQRLPRRSAKRGGGNHCCCRASIVVVLRCAFRAASSS